MPPGRSDVLAGHAALWGAQVAFGLFPIFGTLAFAPGGVTPLGLGAWRIVAGSLVLGALALARHGRAALPERADLPRVLLCSLPGVALNQGLFLVGLSRSTPMNAGLVMCLIPVFTYAFAVIAGQERRSAVRVAGMILALLGVAPLMWSSGTPPPPGGQASYTPGGPLIPWLALLATALVNAPDALAENPTAQASSPAVTSSSPTPATAPTTLRAAAAAAGLAWPPPKVWVHIDKSEHELVLWSGGTALKRYQAGFGDPTGDKVQQGDLKTPTGTFRVVTRNDKSNFHLFLGLSYPDAADADRGVAAGLIDKSQAAAIREADSAGRLPPWDTRLGGAIGIHGGGSSADWTLGCIAVTDDEIEEIWAVAGHGTRVVIEE